MNVSKTKTMLVNKAGEERNIAIDVDGQELEQVRDFKYLGQIITDDGRCDKEVKRRIAIARSNFINMKDVLATQKLKWDTRNSADTTEKNMCSADTNLYRIFSLCNS